MLPFLLGLTLMAIPSPVLTAHTIVTIPESEPVKVWTREEVKAYALEVATEYGLHKQRFLATIECENHFDATGQSDHWYMGKREQSWGAVQIHLPSHPGITQEMAEDPEFAIPWMAKKWLNDEAPIWSCYRDLFM